MKTIGVIPARYASTRFPAKVLAKISGKPMVIHVWEKAKQCPLLDQVIIACDHPDVLKVANDFGANAVMTEAHLPSGSDRIASAIRKLDVDIVVNIQGDEPFIDPKTIGAVTQLLKDDQQCVMGTVIRALSPGDEQLSNPNVVKCVIDAKGYALYFSRSPIPFNRNTTVPTGLTYYKHLGIYAYRKEFLMQYTAWPKGVLESCEQLEQLRVLEQGFRIKTTVTDYESIAVDTPDDLEKAQAWFDKLNLMTK